ncbi:MAG: bifunctional helix-turn-helix transcriptional regulator/GNAT family N-acetyltransferase [Rubrivivax sp.]
MSTPAERIDALLAFNRFYTRRIGMLHEAQPDSKFSVAQSLLLWQLAQVGDTTATELARTIELDAGYLSRLLRGFKDRGLITASRSQADVRQTRLSITAAGRRVFARLDRRSQGEVSALLAALSDAQQQELLAATARIEALLGARTMTGAFVLRKHRPGDIGWVASRHGALYAQEFGWDQRFEALVARIAADFIERFDAHHEACWIAERDGQPIGCVFLVRARDEGTQAIEPGTAQLRMLLVEPSARGLGLGVALVDECERFARQAGYRRIRLWTNSLLLAARGIYQRAGYELVAREPHHSFGHDLVGETWELTLQ